MAEIAKATIADAETGEVSIRDLTTAEIADRKAMHNALKEQTDSKIAARTSALAKLEKLGLTAEEIAAL